MQRLAAIHDCPRRHDQRHCRPLRPGHIGRAQAEQAAGEHDHLPRAEDQASTAAAPAAKKAPVAAASTGGRTYTVKSGDTLGAIAARHGVKLSQVFRWNGLSMTSVIYPGQKIKIGAGGGSGARCRPARLPLPRPIPAPTPSSPAIRCPELLPGTESGSADILSANRLTVTSIIYPGQKLVIPGDVHRRTPAGMPASRRWCPAPSSASPTRPQ